MKLDRKGVYYKEGRYEGKMDDFNNLSDQLYKLRLMIEGACNMFETDMQCLFGLALENGKLEAALAFDTAHAALSDMRSKINVMQLDHMKEEMGANEKQHP